MRVIQYLVFALVLLTTNGVNAQQKVDTAYEGKFHQALALLKAQKKYGKAHRILNHIFKKSAADKKKHPAYAFYALYTNYKGKGNLKQAKIYATYLNKTIPFYTNGKQTVDTKKILEYFSKYNLEFSPSDYIFIETWIGGKLNKKLSADEIIGNIGNAIEIHNKSRVMISTDDYYLFLVQYFKAQYKNLPDDRVKQKVTGIMGRYAHKYPYIKPLKQTLEKYCTPPKH